LQAFGVPTKKFEYQKLHSRLQFFPGCIA
jgi:hypothetical protein